MSEVQLAEFTDRGGAESASEDAIMARHSGGSSGESDSSDNEAVLMTRTAEAVNGSDKDSDDEDSDDTPQNRSKKRVNKLIDSDSETEDHNSPNNEGNAKSPNIQSGSTNHSKNLVNKVLDSDSDDNTTTSNKSKKKSAKSSVHSSDSSDGGSSKPVPHKSRNRRINSSDSGSDSGSSRSKELTKEQSGHSNDKISPRTKKVIKRNSDSSDSDNSYDKTYPKTIEVNKQLPNSDSTNKPPYSDSSNSDSETGPSKYEEQKARMKEKRNKLQQKFKSLVTSRVKETKSANGNESKKNSSSGSEQEDKSESGNSDNEAASIERIKQKMKERAVHLKSTIFDPDTSSDEETAALKHVQKQKKPRKTNKSTSPKPVRMSAKQAMENMQKIKSESNRMLREKEVSLPYHRPKALSLKDIMSKRRPALTSDGKALPIKMSEEQLKLYAQSLEQRQKEVIELCKSDTDDECDDNQPATETDNKNSVEKKENKDNNLETTDSITDPQPDMTSQNDTLFDTLADEINNSSADDTKINSEDKGAIICKTNEIESTTEKQNETKIPSNIVDEGALKNKTTENNEECTEVDMALVYNDSVESIMDTSVDKPKETEEPNKLENTEPNNTNTIEPKKIQNMEHSDKLENTEHDSEKIIETKRLQNSEDSVNINSNTIGTEVDSQLMSLHYDTEPLEEKPEVQNKGIENSQKDIESPQNKDIEIPQKDVTSVQKSEDENLCDDEMMETEVELDNCDEQGKNYDFSDDDIDMADIDDLIENAEIISSQTNHENFESPMLIKDPRSKTNPKLTGAPGMIIDLDGTDPTHRKLTGVQLLKERFSYFSKLKTPEEMERDREKKLKPGNKHQILKQELEDQIAEQRSIEWAKRLEAEKQLHKELELKEENQGSDEEDIDKIEEKLEGDGDIKASSGESEPEENDCDMTDKPVKRNPMLADEAEESDCDEDENHKADEHSDKGEDANDEDNGEDDSEEEEESSESEEEEQTTNKKGRILKAFEDSDEEAEKPELAKADVGNVVNAGGTNEVVKKSPCVELRNTQDDDLQLAQHVKSQSEDLFASQDSALGEDRIPTRTETSTNIETDLGTQTFSIAEGDAFKMPDKLSICDSQLSQDGNLDAVVGMCSGSFSQAIPVSQFPSQLPESQVIGDDVLALCTGKFYDNPFVSQNEDKQQNEEKSLKDDDTIQNSKINETQPKEIEEKIQKENEESVQKYSKIQDITIELTDLKDTRPITESMELNDTVTKEPKPKDDILESILDELNEPEKRPNKYFVGNTDKENKQSEANVQYKKKFVIDSDEEGNGGETGPRKKKLKKRKLEKRALQISDDESDEGVEDEEYASDVDEENEERLVEYDSDENEVEIAPKIQIPKKKQKAPEFFEQEAELTSEDEWMGSGDEDEAGLDRMEREAGDDDQFNQRQLQRELGQIHMRDVLDQDKREVRIIQELLFEDGDLGTGSRQRKFRWKNAEGEEETGTGAVVDTLPDTQEQEFESEEQWRKQRHQRDMFLREMVCTVREMQKQSDSEDLFDITPDQTLIKTSVSKNTSSLQNATTQITTVVVEKATAKDIPSPKKSAFTLFKQNYHGSLLTRGQGALARLAAIASPLAADEDAPKAGSVASGRKKNFVFATLTQEDAATKVTKRKAETNTGTPRLVKKLRTEDKLKHTKKSLLDHLKA